MIGTVVFSVLFGMTLVSTITADELTPLHVILPPLFAILTAVSVWRTVARNIADDPNPEPSQLDRWDRGER